MFISILKLLFYASSMDFQIIHLSLLVTHSELMVIWKEMCLSLIAFVWSFFASALAFGYIAQS